MKPFDILLQEDIANYEGRHDDLIYQAPALYRLLTRLLDEPRLPKSTRQLVLSAIAYFILPVDIISEELEGPYGYVDDIWLCCLVLKKVSQELGTDEILIQHWDGEAPIIELIEDILARRSALVGEKSELILSYIGFEN